MGVVVREEGDDMRREEGDDVRRSCGQGRMR
jgi:hypothetical protein